MTEFVHFQDTVEERKRKRDSDDLLRRAQRSIEERNFAKAYELLRELKATYGETTAADEGRLLLPMVKIKTEEAGSKIVEQSAALMKRREFAAAEKKLQEMISAYQATEILTKAESMLKEAQKKLADEKEAANQLNLIRKLVKEPNRIDFFRKQAEGIIRKFPDTQAAAEAKSLLKTLE